MRCRPLSKDWRYILHADMDAFYASVEQHDHPHLRGKPVVVGGSPEARGVVAAASYEARKLGIHSAMPMRTAVRISKDVVRVSPRFDRYREISRHVIGVANGTDGLTLALRATRIGAGDEVIMASHTYVATAAAVHFNGATPVLVECGKDHLMDVDSAAEAITERTKAIMPVHWGGYPCEMAEITELANSHGLTVVDDAAHEVPEARRAAVGQVSLALETRGRAG